MKAIIYKWHSVMDHRWGWRLDEFRDGWEHIYSTPYYVEIPDEFELCESVYGSKMYFRKGGTVGFEVCETSNRENCKPLLIGGSPVEIVKLKVLGEVK